jgi:hypothetical protein
MSGYLDAGSMTEPIRGRQMPFQPSRRIPRDHAPADRLARAIADIEARIEQLRRAGQPAPLSAYRARRILEEAHARCRERGEARTQSPSFPYAARPDAMPKPHRSRRDPVERYEALPGPPPLPSRLQDLRGCLPPPPRTDLRFRKCESGLPAYEGTTMAYDWTGEATRKRNRVKLAATLLLSLAIMLGIPAAIAPFL